MLKNKYVLWGVVSLVILASFGSASWVIITHGSKNQASLTSATADGQASGSSGDGATGDPTIIAPAPSTGPQISATAGTGTALGGSTGTSSNSAASSEVAKLLDPTTFAQYDKYKDAQTASYIDLQAGTGTAVADGSQVTVLYKGWLTNGTVFDQSKVGSDGKYQAFSFVEGQHQVITGWEAGLAGIKENGVRLLIVPPAAGYGAQGQGPIPGNSVLIFQVQVVQVK